MNKSVARIEQRTTHTQRCDVYIGPGGFGIPLDRNFIANRCTLLQQLSLRSIKDTACSLHDVMAFLFSIKINLVAQHDRGCQLGVYETVVHDRRGCP